MTPIQDHPLRYKLANELHARPFPTIAVPCTVVYLAVKQPQKALGRDRTADLAHLTALLGRHGAPYPQQGATHYSGQIGRHRLKWEQHTEFVTYTAFRDGLSERAFDPDDVDVFSDDWLADAPGQRVTSAILNVLPRGEVSQIGDRLADWFVLESLAVSSVADDAATVAADFRIDPAGHLRFAVFADPAAGMRRVGRIVQHLCEIETYKTMSMLGFSRSKDLSHRIGQLDMQLSSLMTEMTDTTSDAEDTLRRLLAISAELESIAARSSFRFGATGAYWAIVGQRIAALREERFGWHQTFAEFMMRRYEPAMRTVQSTETRLAALSDRAIRAGDLLRTRVDVERSAQNQAVLQSMNRRAALQLRMQHTVEGLSVVAISYYAVSLVGYLLSPLAATVGLGKGTLTALVTLPVMALVWYMVRHIRKRLE